MMKKEEKRQKRLCGALSVVDEINVEGRSTTYISLLRRRCTYVRACMDEEEEQSLVGLMKEMLDRHATCNVIRKEVDGN